MSAVLERSLTALLELKASAAQKRYMLARAAHESAVECASKAKAAIEIPRPSKEDISAICDKDPDAMLREREQHPYYAAVDEIEERYRTHELFVIRTNRENELIAWAQAQCKRVYSAEQYARIAVVFDKWPLHGKLRQDFLMLCVRMEAE